jgi:DNA repair protein RadC
MRAVVSSSSEANATPFSGSLLSAISVSVAPLTFDEAQCPTISAEAELADVATDRVLIETLLAISGRDTSDEDGTADRLLARFGGLGRLLNADADRLSEIPGVDTSTTALFAALRAVVVRIAEYQLPRVGLQHACDPLIHYLRVTMAYQRIEHFRVLFFDHSGNLLADEVQHYGTIDHTPVYPREVVRRALLLEAASVIIAHNHPSNEPRPSTADIHLTRTLSDTLEDVGVTLFDHIVICRSGHSSLRALGLLGKRSRAAA